MNKENVCKLLSQQKLLSLGTAGREFPDNSIVCFSYDNMKSVKMKNESFYRWMGFVIDRTIKSRLKIYGEL